MINQLDILSLLLSTFLFFITNGLIISNFSKKISNSLLGKIIVGITSIFLAIISFYFINSESIRNNIEHTKKQVGESKEVDVSNFQIDTIFSNIDTTIFSIKVKEKIAIRRKTLEEFNIKRYISQYYRLSNFNDFNLIESYYPDTIQRFFTRENLSKREVKEEFEILWKKKIENNFIPNLAEIEYTKYDDYYDIYVNGEKQLSNNNHEDILNRMKINREGYIIYYKAYKNKSIDEIDKNN